MSYKTIQRSQHKNGDRVNTTTAGAKSPPQHQTLNLRSCFPIHSRTSSADLSFVSGFYRMELPSASTTCTVPRFNSRIPASTFARSPTTTQTKRSALRKDFPAVVRSFVVSARTFDAYVEK